MIPQGRLGYMQIAGVNYPVYNWFPQGPRQLVIAQGVGNTWGTNIAEGLQTTRIVSQFICRRGAGEILSSTFWNLFMARTWSGGKDDTGAFTIVGSTGVKTRTYANCKAEAFTLTIAKGAIVGLTGVFLCPGIATKAPITPNSYGTNIDTTSALMFDAATFGGIIGNVYGAEIVFSNNHKPNGPLDGTKFLQSWDAGNVTCSATFTCPEHQDTDNPIPDGTNITVALAGAATRTFSLTSCAVNNPDDLNVVPGQLFQPLATVVTGSASVQPLVIT